MEFGGTEGHGASAHPELICAMFPVDSTSALTSWGRKERGNESGLFSSPLMSRRAVTVETRSSWQEVKWGRGISGNTDAVYASTPLRKCCSWQKYLLFSW